MIAESLAAFALVKGAVDAVKSAVDTAQDVQGISAGLDALFHHRDAAARELKKKEKPTKPKSKLHNFFSKKTGEDTEDELSVGAVAAMVLEQKKIDRDILNLGIRIDNKFGEGTWDEILVTRKALLEERKEKRKKAKEAAAITRQLKADNRLVALDVAGEIISTEKLASRFQQWQMEPQPLTIIIGGPDGLSDGLLSQADQCWSLGRITLPPPLVRVILAEQLYRAWSINANHPYHRA